VLEGPGNYERARPIFDRAIRRFHPIAATTSVSAGDDEVILELATRDGATLHARITFPEPAVARIQRALGTPSSPRTTEMLVDDPPRLPLRVEQSGDAIRVDAGGPALVVHADPWRIEFGEFRTEPDDIALLEWVSEPSGYALDRAGSTAATMYETFSLRPGEELYGLGERFHGPALRGRRLTHWLDEPFGTNTTERPHKSVPLIVSNRGYGVFAHHSEEVVFDLGAASNATAALLVHHDELDLFVMLGSPKEVLRSYTALTGRPPELPDWTYGIWMSRCMYANRAEVAEVLDTADQLGLPVDVIGLDPLWLANRPAMTYDTCDFVWNDADFGPIDEFIGWLHGRGVKLCLWVNTHLRTDSPAWTPERMVDGGAARDRLYPDRGYVDLTGAGADWWVTEMERLLAAGVDAFKLDYSETLPETAPLADGRNGREVRNLYGLLASITAARAGATVHFTRCGTAGSQRYPIHWAGDSQSSWYGMYGALRGGLAAAWSGFAHWTADVGGFYWRDLRRTGPDDPVFREPDPELYIRWMQMAMLLSHTRFHGTTPREPWNISPEAVEVAREFSALRRRLVPYLQACAQEAAATGCPIMRPVALEYPDDRGAARVDTEYLLGPDLLVCPVLQPGGTVDVYVPPGVWRDHFTGDELRGPGWTSLQVPLERLPLLVRDGADPFGVT